MLKLILKKWDDVQWIHADQDKGQMAGGYEWIS
jgi:hypothetical protein